MRAHRETVGACQVCGYIDALNRGSGMVRKHNERRIGRDGLPYASDVECAGSGHPSEPAEVWP